MDLKTCLLESQWGYLSSNPHWIANEGAEAEEGEQILYELLLRPYTNRSEMLQMFQRVLDSLQELPLVIRCLLEGSGDGLHYYFGFTLPEENHDMIAAIETLLQKRFQKVYGESVLRALNPIEIMRLEQRLMQYSTSACFENLPPQNPLVDKTQDPIEDLVDLLEHKYYMLELLMHPISETSKSELLNYLQHFANLVAEFTIQTVSKQSVTTCQSQANISCKLPKDEEHPGTGDGQISGNATRTDTCTHSHTMSLVNLRINDWQDYVTKDLYRRCQGNGLFCYQMKGYAANMETLWLMEQALRCEAGCTGGCPFHLHMNLLHESDRRFQKYTHHPNGEDPTVSLSVSAACSQWEGAYWLSGHELCEYMLPPPEL